MTLTRGCGCTKYRPHQTRLGHCRCEHFAESHDPDTGACRVTHHATRPLTVTPTMPKPPTPDGELLPYPGRVEGGPGLRLGFACWRWRVWDDRAREARAAFQASIDANSQGEGDVWWERHLTTAMGKRALWQARMDRYT